MGSGGDDGGQYYPPPVQPMAGVPVAGQGGGAGADPFNYGKYQSFLPNSNASATGLTEDMFAYRSPNEIMNPGAAAQPPPAAAAAPAAGTGNPIMDMRAARMSGDPNAMRDYLAVLHGARGPIHPQPQAQAAPAAAAPVATPTDQVADWATMDVLSGKM